MNNFIENIISKTKVTKIILFFIMFFSIFISVSSLIFTPERSERLISICTYTFIVSVILLSISNKIRLVLINYLLVSFLFILFTISAYTSAGVHSPSYVGGYLICSFISGLLISPRVGALVSLLSIVSGFILLYLEYKQILILRNTLEPVGIFIGSIAFFLINILIQYFYSNNIRISLDKFNNELKERKEAERILRKNESWLNLVFENINDGIWDFNLVTQDIILSPNYYVMLGYKNLEEKLSNFKEYRNTIHPDDLEIFDNAFKKCIENKDENINIEIRMKTFNNDWKFLLIKGKILERNTNNEITRIVGSHTDITELKTFEKKLKTLNETLEYKVESRNYELVESNEKLNKTLKELKEAQEQIIISEKMASLGQFVASIAHELNTPLGAINSSITYVEKNLEKDIQNLNSSYYNFTNEKKELFSKLLKKSYLNSSNIIYMNDRERKKEFIKILKDVLPNDTNIIADMLLEIGVQNNSEIEELLKVDNIEELIKIVHSISSIINSLKIIKTASSKASKVVNALKTYSHHDESEELVETDIVKEIEMVLTLFFNRINGDVEIIKKYNIHPKVMSYPEKLNQVWLNLINNSLQAINFNGKIEIEIERIEPWVVVSFTDNGIGIPENIKDKIFTPFFTTKTKGEGSGLGLDICKNIIEQIGGNIIFDSKNGETIFRVFLKELK